MRKGLVVAALAMLLSGVGCSTASVEAQPAKSSVEDAALMQQPPLRVALFADQSKSANWSRVELIDIRVIDLLIEALNERGGEIAFGLIRDDSNKGLVRLSVPVPPVPPSLPEPAGNPFSRSKQRAARDTAVAKFEAALREHEQTVEPKISVFREEVERLIAQPVDAPATDIWSALSRADLFLGERDATGSKPMKFIIFVSDGINTVRRKRVNRIESGAQIVVVNGAALVGDLGDLNPLRFENLEAAASYVITKEEE